MNTGIPTIIGSYRVEREIARGGMGIVYLAHDTRLNRAAAIKALPDDVASNPDRLARFKQEAQVLASFNHPNIAGIYGLEESGGRRYLALEYVEGETLAERIARGPLAIDETVGVCLQIAAGVEVAHEAGIIHRDLKPGNVMITRSDVVKILDFGLAKGSFATESRQTSENSPTLTASPATIPGAILGTARYLSPEQARGKPVDRRTDIWSFGCVLYECLTGEVLFEGETVSDTIAKILGGDVAWAHLPRDTPARMHELLQRCLERDSSKRLRDIGEARLALEDLKAGRGSAGVAPARGVWLKAHLSGLLPMGAVLLIAALGLLLYMNVGPGKRRASTRPTTSLSIPVPHEGTFSAETPSIAVLAFADLSPGKDQEYFSDGLSEELINVLANIHGLRVVSRTSAFSFKGKDVDLATVAQKLNVSMILEGSVRKAGEQLRITAQLIQVATDSHLWSQTYDRPFEDVFAIQEDIAQSVVREMRGVLLGERLSASAIASANAEVREATRGRGDNAEAYQLYLQGVFFRDRLGGDPADPTKSIGYFQQALRLDPGYARAWAGLSFTLGHQAGAVGGVPLEEGYRRAREAAKRAIQLEPDLPDGYAALGQIQLFHDWDWKRGEQSVRRALELAPGDAAMIAIAADLARVMGRPDEAAALGRRAVALDPVNANLYSLLGLYCLMAGFLDEAAQSYNKALDLKPNLVAVHQRLSLVQLTQGRVDQAMKEIEQEPLEDWRLLGRALVHHAKGRRAESDAALRELIEKYAQEDACQIAEAYAYRGEVNQSFEWLERAHRQRDGGLADVKVDPLLRNLHADERWKPFLKKMGFTD